MCIYRAKKGKEPDSFKSIDYKNTRRPPSNVPYMVDNLWEWARPEEYPNRRHAKFASPKPEQALRSADLPVDSLEDVFCLEFVGEPVIAQLPGVEDAKMHSDCDDLRSTLFDLLGGKYTWCTEDFVQKHPAGQLFQPCLTAEEVDYLLDTTEELHSRKEEIREEVDYWDDLELIGTESIADEEKGEILFQFKDPGEEDGYWRRAADSDDCC